ncbi:MAG: TonB-dependent receptor [Gammaproteobacteria bacterium]|nr:TonB-dependent receptor [Gammaproteobacteria bacterium]
MYDRGLQSTFDYNVTASFDLTADITSATSFGAQYFTKESLTLLSRGDELPNSAVSTVGAAARTRGDEDFVETKSAGLFIQETIGWRDQLYVTAALRGDAHSAFGETFNAVYYPKLSASWVLSDTDFWNVGFAESFRLRAAWGKSGLQPDAFAAVRTYSPTTGPGDEPALLPGNLGNPDLKPEVGTELELGFDAGLFSDRLGIEFTYYNQTTRDAILADLVAPSLGFPGSRFINVGEVNNKGIELTLNTQVIRTPGMSFDLGATAAYNDNLLVSLGEGRERIQADTRGRFQHRVGYPLGGYWSKYIASARWDPNNPTRLIDVMCEGPDPSRAPTPCSQAPFHYLGPPGPVWQGSFTQSLALPNLGLTLNALWNYTWESRRFSTTTWQRDRNTRNTERAQLYLMGTLDPIQAAEIQTFDIEHPWMERDDHLRLRELSLTYELPGDFVEGYGVSRAAITLSGRNIWTPWVHESFSQPGLDPETRRTRDNPWGWQQTQAPLPHSFLLSFRVRF